MNNYSIHLRLVLKKRSPTPKVGERLPKVVPKLTVKSVGVVGFELAKRLLVPNEKLGGAMLQTTESC